CGVNRAVVRTEGHLARTRHLAFTIFMQDFSRLLIAPVVFFLSLVARQHTDGLRRELRIEEQRLVCGNNGVAAKHGSEPGDSRGNDMFLAFRNLQRVQISFECSHHLIEDAIRGTKMRRLRLPKSKIFAALPQLLPKIRTDGARTLAFYVGNNRGLDLEPLKRRKLQSPA